MKNSLKFLALSLTVFTALSVFAVIPAAGADEALSDRMKAVIEFGDTVLSEARFTKNSALSGLFADGLNVDTREPVIWKNSGENYYTSNLAMQQNLFRTLSALTNLTGDERYKDAAKQQFRYYFDNYMDSTGLFYWGGHRMMNLKREGIIGEQNVHELKEAYPAYDLMYEVDPEATLRFIEAYWNAHVIDWSKLEMNRHGDYNKKIGPLWNSEWGYPDDWLFEVEGLPFAAACVGMDYAALKYSELTGDKAPLTWIKRMFELYLDSRHPVTGLGGSQFGTFIKGDRAALQYGEYFGEAAIEGWAYIRASGINIHFGNTIFAQIDLSKQIGDMEMAREYAGIYEAFCEHMYRPELDAAEPMFADGSSVVGFKSPPGYYGQITMGYAALKPQVFTTGVYAYFTKPSQLIWDTVRDMGDSKITGFIGDIGTEPGKNVNLNFETGCNDAKTAMMFIYMYDQTGCRDYFEMAKHIGDNIVKKNFVKGLFVSHPDHYEARLDTPEPYVLLTIEAYERGMPELCPFYMYFSEARTHWTFDGRGRQYDEAVRYNNPRINPASLSLNTGSITLKTGEFTDFEDIDGHWAEEAIMVMRAKGMISGHENTYGPDAVITKAEYLSILNKMGAFASLPYNGKFKDITGDEWYADIVQGAHEGGFLDVEMSVNDYFAPNAPITREEAAALTSHALVKLAPAKVYAGKWFTDKFDDKQNIGRWSETYINMVGTVGIMTGVSENEFAPKSSLTRASAAVILSRLENLVNTPDLEGTVFPDNATNKNLTFTSSNPKVVSVSENGIITAIAPGDATITVSTDNGISQKCTVNVLPVAEGTLSGLRVAGSTVPGFDPEVYSYTYHTASGTKVSPKIAATAYEGEVDITYPQSLPGTAVVKTQSRTYKIEIIPDKLIYILNEDFEKYQAGVAGTDQTGAGYPFTSPSYNQGGGYIPITVETRDDEAGGQYLYMPVDTTMQSVRQLNFNLEKPVALGVSADDLQLVLEADIKFNHKTTQNTSIQLRTAEGISALTLLINESVIYNRTQGGNVEIYNCLPNMNTFFTIKLVLDKKTHKFDFYVDGELKAFGQEMLDMSAAAIKRITIQAGPNSRAQTWLDNYKVYNAVVEMSESMEETVEKPIDAEFTPMSIDFNDLEMLRGINGQGGWYTPAGNADGSDNAVTVMKRQYKMGISDKVLHVPGANTESPSARTARIDLTGPIELGRNGQDGKFVLEYEFCVGGSSAGMGVSLTDDSDGEIARFVTTGASYRYVTDAGTIVKFFDEGEGVRGYNTFITCKIVIDIMKCTADIYKNGEILAGGVPLYKELTSGKIAKLKVYAGEATVRPLYIDNIKMYLED